MSKPFIELPCPDYNEINSEIIDFLENRTCILQKDPRKDPSLKIPYPNFVSSSEFIRNNPKLRRYFDDLGLKLYHVYYAVAFEPNYPNAQTNLFPGHVNPLSVSSCPIHLDRPPVQWKMNWPVLNMNETGVTFYKLKDPNDDIKQYLIRTGIAGSMEQDVWNLPYEPFDIWQRHVFNQAPILMNGLVPHDVWFNPDIPTPRIGLQIMFFKEPRHLLDPDCVILDEA